MRKDVVWNEDCLDGLRKLPDGGVDLAGETVAVIGGGNTAIDALLHTVEKARRRGRLEGGGSHTLLVTAHRRESHGAGRGELPVGGVAFG